MYLTDEILEKLNASALKENKARSTAVSRITLPDIMVRSFAEVKSLTGDALSWGEKNFLYQQAQKELKENKMAESRILSRANPQLTNAVRLGIRQSSMLRSYDDLFPQRASSFVKPGSVASMFSPAGYLTELYREARGLHADTSQYHLDTRRPDLASLSLSQSNMDEELSTLSLSNELLLNNIAASESLDYGGVMEMLSTYRQTGATPFHLPYEATRQSILLQDPELLAFRRNPVVAAKMDTASLLGIAGDISPELRAILTEEITDANADDLIKKNFGDISLEAFQNIAYLARWYGVTYDEMSSLLGIVTVGDNLTQYYQNDQLITLVESGGALAARVIKRQYIYHYSKLNWVEIIPVQGNKYKINLSFNNNSSSAFSTIWVGTSREKYSHDIVDDKQDKLIDNKVYSYIHELTADSDSDIYLWIGCYNETTGRYIDIASVNFVVTEFNFNDFLLKLNKVIRLYKATGIAPSDIRTVIESSNNDLTITDEVLSQLFWVHYYMRTYGIDVSAALVLSGAAISQITHGNEPSAFDRLFNTPLLNNTVFSADGTALSLEPGASDDTFRLGVLKRAFQVNNTELSVLWELTGTDFTATVENLSALYRTRLLAEVNGLSVTELNLLLSVSPYAGVKLGSLQDTKTTPTLSTLVSFIASYTQWLKDQNWTVGDLYLMLTSRFSTALTPDIENLITTLKNGLTNQDLSQSDEDGLITAAAPFIAAATQLDSAETAAAILQWLDQLKPQSLAFKDFLSLVNSDSRTDAQTTSLVAYCQVMGQLALIARNASLSASELSWVVTHPAIITEKATVLGHDIATLYDLTQLHAFLAHCGTHASEILTSLSGNAKSEKNNLDVKTAAAALILDEQALAQALSQCSSYKFFYSWIHLNGAMQWLNVATLLGITPADVAALVKLTDSSPYSDWVAASHARQAGLNAQQTAQLQATLDEATSSAISAYVIKNGAPSWVTDRDKLYSWLLIDNQVSAQIKTTRIAEAIASVQLYVNRALAGQEEGVVNEVKSKTFFTSDWDTYNKRYSTWAGVSELVYYPENYVDPTMRIGQTGMMDEMLQTLSQSQLTSDTVEDAFKTYMTRFEEIANLDIISGYHDGVSDENGKTYLIGRSAIGEYYWRRTDIDKMSDGRLPANAWSEWKKITAGIAPVTNLVRPVIFQSRLYVVWVESREVATTGSATTKAIEYLLKYAHILHDGTWSAPVTIMPAQGTLPPKDVAIADTGMYCAQDAELEKLYIYFYKKADSYSTLPASIAGLSLHPDGTTENIPAASAAKTAGYIYLQLDTTSAVRLNTPYTGGSTRISISDITSDNGSWGDGDYTYMRGGELSNVTAEVSGDNVVINFNATARITYNGYGGTRTRRQVDMMKSSGAMGDTFYLPTEIITGAYASSNSYTADCIVNKSSKRVFFLPSDMYVEFKSVYPVVTRHTIYYAIAEKSPTSALPTNRDATKIYSAYDDRLGNFKEDIFVCRSNPFPAAGPDFHFKKFDYIDTNISTASVKVAIGDIIFTSETRTKFSFDESLFSFNNKNISVPLDVFSGNTAQITFTLSANAPEGDLRSLGSEIFTITLTRVDESSMPVITLNRTDTYAQYLQYGAYRIRVNTLFAKQLVARANTGLNAVLSWETQQLQEPKLGEGSFVEVIFSRYDAALHGDGSYQLYLIGARDRVNNSRSKDLCASGNVSINGEITRRIFVPWNAGKATEPNNVFIGVVYSDKSFCVNAADMQLFTYNTGTRTFASASDNATRTRGLTSNVLSSQTEPMDFSGANAIYFWEMFYYVPMMVFKRLLSEGKFSEATQWIKYIWSPDGYLVNGEPASYQWNVRPLEEETTWNANPLDSVDPDAVAQADPMHYKVAAFMSWLDLLIARGDAAYRQLERDTLNEAKMWYVQALNILGDEPYLNQHAGWTSPRLTDAADQTAQKLAQQALLATRQQVASGELRTANSLTSLFLPQQNEKLAGYWQTLAQRLYNLRHNLSIDGSPLSLSIYAAPADPAALLSAAVVASQGSADLPTAVMPLYRFPVMLESARAMVSQLTQFGSTLLGITERQDAEALSELLQTQGSELVLQSVALQDREIAAIDADKAALEESRSGAQSRLSSYTALYEENVNTGEKQAMDLYLSSSVISTSATALHMAGAALEMVPNIYGMAVGGARYGALLNAGAIGMQVSADATRIAADRLSQSEAYRRRRQEWEIQRNAAQSEVKQIDAQLASLAVRREAAVLQKGYLETQQAQTQAQMAFLQNKFTSKALYNWLRGKLAAIYYQFYDLSVSRCLMAQKAYQWTSGTASVTFIRPGAWQGTYAGLMAGETLMLNLAQMEQSYLQKDEREKEVTRTVCLSEVYTGLPTDAFSLTEQVVTLVTAGKGSVGSEDNGLTIAEKQLRATLKLSDLNIAGDYPASLGKTRRIKQISVTLPALVGPYQDVRAVLSYGGSVVLPQGCTAAAVSHGMNDGGQFQLDFNDSRWLPFEGIPVGDSGTLTLSFPDVDGRQKDLLLSLTDIILHIRYTIGS